MIDRFKSLAAILAATSLLLVACSSSTSSSGGSGQIPTGLYSGVFNGQTSGNAPTSTRAQLSLTVPVITDANGGTTIDNDGISGNLAITGGERCFKGGPIDSGSVFGNNMTLVIADSNGADINMTGRVTDDTYRGTFSAENSNCGPISGGFEFDRA